MDHRDRHGRDENSLLFDLDALLAEADDDTPLPFDSAPARPPAAARAPIAPLLPLVAPPRRSRWATALTVTAVALAGGVALAAAGGIAYTLVTDDAPAAEIATEAATEATEQTRIVVGQAPPVVEAAPIVATLDPPAPVAAPPPTPEPVKTAAQPDPAPEVSPTPRAKTATKRPRRPSKPRPPSAARAQTEDRPDPPTPAIANAPVERPSTDAEDEVSALLGHLDGPGDRPTAAPEPPTVRHVPIALPERLTRRQILHVARRTGPKMNRCPGDGRYSVELRISPAGRVERAEVRGADPAVRTCVGRLARQMVFPHFDGDPMTIDLPFML